MGRSAMAVLVVLAALALSAAPTRLVPPRPWAPGVAQLAEMRGRTSAPAPANHSADARCTVSASAIDCKYQSTTLAGGRWVGYQTPEGTPPKAGWPVVILYHGTNLYNSEYAWYAEDWYYYGLFYKAQVIAGLLEAGYTVVTPDALKSLGYWQTNLRKYATADVATWKGSDDDALTVAITAACTAGTFGGPCDVSRMSAIGFSSGAYMTSRMAFNYPGDFKALAVQSGSYYYCSGPCTPAIADQLPASLYDVHPPTLFLHGTQDNVVPPSTSEMYLEKLESVRSIPTKRITARTDHAWIDTARDDILAWLKEHDP